MRIYAVFIYVVSDSSMIMDKFRGSLDTLITGDVLKKPKMVDILWQIAFGLNHLHENNIIHGRLKPSNVLLQENRNKVILKVSDYGLDQLGINHQVSNQNS